LDLYNHINEENSKISYSSNSTKHSYDKSKKNINQNNIKDKKNIKNNKNNEINDIIKIKDENQGKPSKNYTSNDKSDNVNNLKEKTKRKKFFEKRLINILDSKDEIQEEKLKIIKEEIINKKVFTKEEIKNSNIISNKLENIYLQKNYNLSEKNSSFEINFDNWCRKTFKKEAEESKNHEEINKEKEKEILKNGNIDELYDYINANENKTEKKKNKKKKNKKNKNNNNDKDSNIIDKLNSTNKEDSFLNNRINEKINVNKDKNKIYDAEVELFKENILKDAKKASDIIKVKPIFSSNWLDMLN